MGWDDFNKFMTGNVSGKPSGPRTAIGGALHNADVGDGSTTQDLVQRQLDQQQATRNVQYAKQGWITSSGGDYNAFDVQKALADPTARSYVAKQLGLSKLDNPLDLGELQAKIADMTKDPEQLQKIGDHISNLNTLRAKQMNGGVAPVDVPMQRNLYFNTNNGK